MDGLGLNAFVDGLKGVLQPFSGGHCSVQIGYYSNNAKTILQLGDDWRIHPTDELVLRLKKFLSASAVEVKYR